MNGGGSVASLSLVLSPRDLQRAEAVIRMRGSKSLLQIENILILPQLCSLQPENRMEIHTQGNREQERGVGGWGRSFGNRENMKERERERVKEREKKITSCTGHFFILKNKWQGFFN